MRCMYLLLALALGCGGSDPSESDDPNGDTDAPEDTDLPGDDDDFVPCTASVVGVTPSPGSDAPVHTAVVATFSAAIGPDDHVDIGLSDADGPVDGALSLASDGLSATFTPAAPLAHETQYQMTVEVCEVELQGSFWTYPGPLDPQVLEARTFGIAYDDVEFIEPQNTTLLTPDFDYIMVQVDEVDAVAQTFESVAATGNEYGGEILPTCPAPRAPTSDLSDNPGFTVGPTNLVYPWSGGELEIQAFLLEGRFSADGDAMLNVYLRGLVDTEEALGFECALAALLTVGTCLPCPAGGGECLLIEAVAPHASWLPDVDVVGTCEV